jgi:lysophospholipase L1-like esterase
MLTVNQVTPTITWAPPSPITYGTTLSATQLDATASVPGTFAYDPAPATVLTAGIHQLSVTFTPTNSVDYAVSSAAVSITVNQATPTIAWTPPAPITYGTALSATQLDSIASVPGTFVYNPALATVLTAGVHQLSVTFTPTDSVDYTGNTAAISITVNQASPTISWIAPAAITYGTALGAAQLSATASTAGTFTYTPAAGTVLTTGTQQLSVTFTPTDSVDYTSASATASITITPATPQITWVPAFPIAVGVGLTSGQLNATVSVPGIATEPAGSFIYSPPAGTIFNSVGPQTLTVTFTPTDSADLTPAQTSISANVSSFGIVAWGDSLTYGNEGSFDVGNYPSELEPMLVLPVVNEGNRGDTSTQIGVREGGIPTYATVEGGVIPASGGVTVTFPQGYEPCTVKGPAGGTAGTILGVHGVVTYDSTSRSYTFTPSTAGVEVSAPGSPQFVVDTPYASYLPVFWEGRNDYNVEPWIVSDLAAQVATVPPGQNYLVLSLFTANRDIEWPGGPSYQFTVDDNAALAKIYGTHYLDIWTPLLNSYDPTQATDVTDYSRNEVPTSLHAVGFYTSLGNSIGPADTNITVTSPNIQWVVGTFLVIDTGANAEGVLVTGVNGSTLTVQRNFSGNNTSHAAGTVIAGVDILHLNARGYQIVANLVAQYLYPYQVP